MIRWCARGSSPKLTLTYGFPATFSDVRWRTCNQSWQKYLHPPNQEMRHSMAVSSADRQSPACTSGCQAISRHVLSTAPSSALAPQVALQRIGQSTLPPIRISSDLRSCKRRLLLRCQLKPAFLFKRRRYGGLIGMVKLDILSVRSWTISHGSLRLPDRHFPSFLPLPYFLLIL